MSKKINVYLNQKDMFKAITTNNDVLIDTIKRNTKIFSWLLSTAKQERKYIKIPKEFLRDLEKESKKRKVPVGVLIGISIILLMSILTDKKDTS